MKIGFNLLLWTTNVQSEHWPILEDIKRVGYDGVEIPVFGGAPLNTPSLAAVSRRSASNRRASASFQASR